MNVLKETIDQLSKEERRIFRLYASRFNPHDSRKDIFLFDQYCRGRDDEEIRRRLYGSASGKNAYYRLKNRLLEEINKTLVMDNTGLRPVSSHYYFSLYHYFLHKNNFSLAYYYIRRVEKQAREYEQYDLLDMMYGELIRLSREILTINPEEFIQLRKENAEVLANVRQIDEILSVLSYRLKITQNLGSRENPVLDIYEKTINEFAGNHHILQTPLFRIRIYKLVSQLLIQRQNYEHLEPFLVSAYGEFMRDGIFTKTTHDTRVEMLIYLVNTLNALKKYNQSIPYLEQLYNALLDYNKLLYNKYLYFYYQAKVACYSRVNPDMAIDILKEMLHNKELTQSPFYQILTYSNLAFLYFEKQDYHGCIRAINKIYINSFYPKVDISLKAKLTVQELLARYEMQDTDVLEYRLEQVRKDIDQEWKGFNGREIEFIAIIERIVRSPDFMQNDEIRRSAGEFLDKEMATDTELIDYNLWLKKRLKMG